MSHEKYLFMIYQKYYYEWGEWRGQLETPLTTNNKNIKDNKRSIENIYLAGDGGEDEAVVVCPALPALLPGARLHEADHAAPHCREPVHRV